MNDPQPLAAVPPPLGAIPAALSRLSDKATDLREHLTSLSGSMASALDGPRPETPESEDSDLNPCPLVASINSVFAVVDDCLNRTRDMSDRLQL